MNSQKKLLFLLIAAMMMMLLAACGSTEPTAPEEEVVQATAEPEPAAEEEAAEEEEEAAEEEAAAEEMVVTHPQGETTVVKNPQRVVVFNYSALDTLDQLGIPVVGVPQGPLMPPHLEKYNGDEYVNIGSFREADMEAINSLDPDLIIIGLRTSPMYEDMSKIAPTIDMTVDWTNTLPTFKEYVTNFGVIFDKEDEVAEHLAEIDEQIASVREAAEASGQKGLIVLTSGGELSAYGPGSRFGMIHDMLGVAPVDGAETLLAETHGDAISFEFILEQNPDVLFVIDRDSAVGAEGESAAEMMDNELVAGTTAGANGNIVYLDPINWYLADAGMSTLPAMINDVASGVGGESAEASADESSAAEGAKEIEHEVGTTTITGVPERIVVLEYSFADHLAMLGINPVGYAVDSMPDYLLPFTEEAGAEAVGTRKEPSLEAITALNPDLIIADLRRHEAIYDQLSAIAPTVIFNSLRGSYQDQLDTFNVIAEILEKEEEASALLAEYEGVFEATSKETNAEAGEFVIGVLWSGGFTAHSNESFMGSFLESLGRTNALAPQEEETQYLLELEGMASINPSSIVILCAPEDQSVLDDLQSEALWQAFDAVKNNHVYVFNRNLWSKGRGLMAFQAILDDSVRSGLLPESETESDTLVCPEAASQETADDESADESAGDAAAFPTTIDHKFGSTTISEEPQRVITVGYSEQDAVLALGVVPIAVRDWFGDQPYGVWPWSQDALGDAEPELMQMPFGELNLELITSLNPDLLIATHSGITEDEYDLLSQIAPVLAQPEEYPDFGVPWQVQTELIGQALGRNAEANELIDDVEAAIDAANEMNDGFGGATVAWATPAGDGQFWVVGENTPPMRFLARLGLTNDPTLQEIIGEADSAQISEEQINLLDVDLLILRTESAELRAEIEADPLLSQLNVFKEGRVIFFEGNDPVYGALSFSTVTSLPYLIDEFVPMIAETLANESGTDDAQASDDSESEDANAAEAESAQETTPLPRTVIDFNGEEVVIEDDSAIIALDGPVTEIVYALGAGDRLVATDSSSTYPQEATELPQVGYVRRLSAEPVLGMAPTLILTTDDAGPPEAVEQLRESGVTIAQFASPSTVEESMQLVRDVATALGLESNGEELVAKMESDLAEAEELLAQVETTPRVMFIYARGMDTVMAAGSGTSVDVMFELAGVTNAVTEWEEYQPLTAEGAVSIAPDALLLFDTGLESVGGAEGLLGVPGIAETPAGQNQNIHAMDGLMLTGLGPRIGEAVIELINMMHPEFQ